MLARSAEILPAVCWLTRVPNRLVNEARMGMILAQDTDGVAAGVLAAGVVAAGLGEPAEFVVADAPHAASVRIPAAASAAIRRGGTRLARVIPLLMPRRSVLNAPRRTRD